MNQIVSLERIGSGEISADAAWKALAAQLEEKTARARQAVYGAVCQWVWRAVRAARNREELFALDRLLRRIGVKLDEDDPAMFARLQALRDMIELSVHAQETAPVEDVLKREHVAAIMSLLNEADGGRMDREHIVGALGLKQSNATRILDLMERAGLVVREREGRRCIVALPAAHREVATRRPRDEVEKRVLEEAPSVGVIVDDLFRRIAENAALARAYAQVAADDDRTGASRRVVDPKLHWTPPLLAHSSAWAIPHHASRHTILHRELPATFAAGALVGPTSSSEAPMIAMGVTRKSEKQRSSSSAKPHAFSSRYVLQR